MTAVHLTLLRLDTTGARQLAKLGDVHAGVAVVTVRPDTRRPGWIARDLMAAVGIRHDVSGRTRRDADDQQLAPLWLAAHGIGDVVAVGIETLSPDLLAELVELVTLAGAQLWLVADHIIPDALSDALALWPVTPCPPREFARRWPSGHTPAAPSAAPPSVDDDLPDLLPQVDFPLFRAVARRQLAPATFATFDRRYLAALRDAVDQLTAGAEPVEVLRAALDGCQSQAAVTITVRAVQAAAFRAGYHLRVDLDGLLALDDHAPIATAADPSTWHQLRAYGQPLRPTAAALTLAGLPPQLQLAVRVDDADLDRPAVRADDEWHELPAPAAAPLRALVLTRLAAGATGTDPLFAQLDGSEVSTRTLADAIGQVQRETGLRLTARQVRRVPESTTRWANRRRITAATLERT